MKFPSYAIYYHEMTAGTYESGTVRVLEDLIKPGMVVVDVGAHIGFFTLLAAKKVGPAGKVYAFEPNPLSYALLVDNIALNGYQNAVAVQKALSNRTGSAALFLNQRDSMVSSLYQTKPVTLSKVRVQTVTLDAFLDEKGWPPVHVVKMDVEGSELDVLQGMGGVLAKNLALTLIVEFAPALLLPRGITQVEYLEAIGRLGFGVRLVADGSNLVTFTRDVRERLLRLDEGRLVNLVCEKIRH